MGSDGGCGKLSPLATPSATRRVLERHGLYTKYGLGQNFLVNDDVIRKILELAEVGPRDTVLEVGPGIGTLTYALLTRAREVVAIEKDAELPAVLADTLQEFEPRFTLLSMDALDLGKLAEVQPGFGGSSFRPNKFVANLPYAVAATVVLEYLQRLDSLESATVMVQKEVADRMTAKPGSKTYGAYTVKLGLVAQPAGRFSVAPGNFFPPPRVDSSVLRLNRQLACDDTGRPLSSELMAAACTMADAAFATRRKTFANSCKTYFAGQPQVVAALPRIFEEAGIDPLRRGETLNQEEFIRLAQAMTACQAVATVMSSCHPGKRTGFAIWAHHLA